MTQILLDDRFKRDRSFTEQHDGFLPADQALVAYKGVGLDDLDEDHQRFVRPLQLGNGLGIELSQMIPNTRRIRSNTIRPTNPEGQ